jgi:hypothetical protein
MTIAGYKRWAIGASIVSLILLMLCGALYWRYGWLYLQVAMASEQTHIFEAMCEKAVQSDTEGAAGCLRYVVWYYPSGSKQDTGSRLDRIVERERAYAVRDIIAILRSKSSEDLGDDPEPWIKKYAK